MHKILSDLIENVAFAVIRRLNDRCDNDPLPGEPVLATATEVRAIYAGTPIFMKVTQAASPRWQPERRRWQHRVARFRMPSQFTPVPAFRQAYQTMPANHHIRGFRMRSTAAGREASLAVVFCHGWAEPALLFEQWTFLRYLLNRLPGSDIFALELPYHMRRKPAGAPFSGSYFFDGNPLRNIEAVRQGVSDLSQIVHWLRPQYDHIVVLGFSLGGQIVALLATSDPRADLYIIGQFGDLREAATNMLRISPCFERAMQRRGLDADRAMALYDPMLLHLRRPVVPGDRIATIAGAYDQLFPPASVAQLSEFFDARYRLTYPAGHLSMAFVWPGLMRKIAALVQNSLQLQHRAPAHAGVGP